jgi:hypothetical protein
LSPTGWNENQRLYRLVQRTFHEKPQILRWSGGNTARARGEAARQLQDLIKTLKPGEQLNIIAHSHGGNVAFLGTQGTGSPKVDNLITLGTPIRSDYQPNEANFANHVNVFSQFDAVQTHGGFTRGMGTAGVYQEEIGPAGRTVGGAHNVEAGLPNLGGFFGANNHSALWGDTRVWQQKVEPLLKK